MARTNYLPVLTIMCIVTKVVTVLWASVTILWSIIPIHASSENLWPRQCLNHYEHSDLVLWPVTLDQRCDTFFGPGQQCCEKLNQFIYSVKSYGSHNVKNQYVHSDLDLWAVTLDQGQDTSLGPV